jgi:hypothetical protein
MSVYPIKIDIEITKDAETIKKVIFSDGIREDLLQGQVKQDHAPLFNDQVIWYLFKVNEETAGFLVLTNVQDEIWSGDIAILPKFRGKIGLELGKMALKKHFKEQKCSDLVALIKKKNRKSLFYTLSLGFKKIGENKDEYILGADYGRIC